MFLVLLLAQNVASAPLTALQAEGQPVRVWLEAPRPLIPGALVHTYVQTAAAGNLVVLHRRTDGGVEVLFPTAPGEDPFTPPGTYEIVAGDRGAAFVTGAVGQGAVLAALAPEPMNFVEFEASSDAWDAAAFSTAWVAPDPESQFTDAVQRMLGDGSFNYDMTTYEVVPPVYAYGDTTQGYPDSLQSPNACLGCSNEGWSTWALPLAPACFSAACRVFGGRGSWIRPCDGASCDAEHPATLAVYRAGRPNGIRTGPAGQIVGRSRLGALRRPSVSPTASGGLRVLASYAERPSATQRGQLRELPPLVIVQSSSRVARSTAPDEGSASRIDAGYHRPVVRLADVGETPLATSGRAALGWTGGRTPGTRMAPIRPAPSLARRREVTVRTGRMGAAARR